MKTGAEVRLVVAKIPGRARRRIAEARFLVVDEISMLDAKLLDCLDAVCRLIRGRPAVPLGGLVALFCGDFVQLSSVPDGNVFPGAFKAAIWHQLLVHHGVLRAACSIHAYGAQNCFTQQKRRISAHCRVSSAYCCLPNFGRCGRSQDRLLVNCPLVKRLNPAE